VQSLLSPVDIVSRIKFVAFQEVIAKTVSMIRKDSGFFVVAYGVNTVYSSDCTAFAEEKFVTFAGGLCGAAGLER
jgi:hypothetical protein